MRTAGIAGLDPEAGRGRVCYSLSGMRSRTVQRLKCALCGRWSDSEAENWRAYHSDDLTGEEPAEVVFFCPDCANREFGQTRG